MWVCPDVVHISHLARHFMARITHWGTSVTASGAERGWKGKSEKVLTISLGEAGITTYHEGESGIFAGVMTCP